MESMDLCCRVCGWRLERPPWGSDGRTPSFETCPCCGVEFGYQDFTPLGATRYRKLWVKAGARWAQPHKRPTDWDLEPQMEQVPLDFIVDPEKSSLAAA
jgi:hypothetical protein